MRGQGNHIQHDIGTDLANVALKVSCCGLFKSSQLFQLLSSYCVSCWNMKRLCLHAT